MTTSIQKARALRSNLTDAEQFLWQRLRYRQIEGHKFRRQRPVGPYIVDFVCLEVKLIIEVDGGQHSDNKTYDMVRDRWLEEEGYRVLRFWNNEVLKNIEGVIEIIQCAADEPPPVSSPGFGGGRYTRGAVLDKLGGSKSMTKRSLNKR